MSVPVDEEARGGALMPYATNALDGNRVYFEDDGGDGTRSFCMEG
jgi:hypothetical protein